MRAHVCCRITGGDAAQFPASRSNAGVGGRARKLGAWLIPGMVLAVIPKCPMCFAAYLAVAGIGVSMPVATGMRWAILAVCVGTLIGVSGRLALGMRRVSR